MKPTATSASDLSTAFWAPGKKAEPMTVVTAPAVKTP
jgi:hypothetical protein